MSIAASHGPPSERRFGITFTAIFFALGIYGLVRSWEPVAYGAWLGVGVLVGLITLIIPRILAPLNRAWFRLGELLGKVVSPVVLGIIFFGLLTPISCITRLFGRDELRLKRRAVTSYWISRNPPGPTADSLRNQF